MGKMKKNLNYLVGEIIVLKNGSDLEFFKIIGSDSHDFILEKINPIIIDDPTVVRTFNKKSN